MRKPGQVVLFRFPETNLKPGKPRPALLLGQLPGPYNDWLICMISTEIGHYIPGFDELVQKDDVDFAASGLRAVSLIRVGRLAVVEGGMLLGAIGEIDGQRLQRIKASQVVLHAEQQIQQCSIAHRLLPTV